MILNTLSLGHIRNYAEASFTFHPDMNVISGANGTGKTNLLESVFYLSCCRALRAARESDMIAFESKEGFVDAEFVSGGRTQCLSITLRRQGRRTLALNQAALKSPRELMGLLPCVFFRPEDLDLLRGGAAARRTYMDMALCQLRPRYLDALYRYRRLHEGKQKLLRLCVENRSYLDALPEYNAELAQTGVLLAQYRAVFVETVAQRAAQHHSAISGGRETLELTYRTQMTDDAEDVYAHMERRREAELARVQCLVGAHKDDIDAQLNGRSVRDFASQGQTRTAALAMKLAMRDAFRTEWGEPPLLLLDDVLSELDEGRQRYLLDHTGDGQTFISCCEPDKVTRGGRNITLPAAQQEE